MLSETTTSTASTTPTSTSRAPVGHTMRPAVIQTIVGVGVWRNGVVVRAATGTMVDEVGLVLTANHNVDRLHFGDVVVVSVPTASGMQMAVPPIGTYGYNPHEEVEEGELPIGEQEHWVWTHRAKVAVHTLHHEQNDQLGNPGLDLAVLRLTHSLQYLDDDAWNMIHLKAVNDHGAATGIITGFEDTEPGQALELANATRGDSSHTVRAGAGAGAGLVPPAPTCNTTTATDAAAVASTQTTATTTVSSSTNPWEAAVGVAVPDDDPTATVTTVTATTATVTTTSSHPKAAVHTEEDDWKPVDPAAFAPGALFDYVPLPINPPHVFNALPIGNSDLLKPNDQLLVAGMETDTQSQLTTVPITVTDPKVKQWMYAQPKDIISPAGEQGMTGAPVFHGGHLIGVIIAAQVPWKEGDTDEVFFTKWTVETPPGTPRVGLDSQPLRPINLAKTIIRYALQLAQRELHRVLPRATWAPSPHSDLRVLDNLLQPYVESDEYVFRFARRVHASTRGWFVDEFKAWYTGGFKPPYGRILRLRGPSGVGKTALCAQLCRQCAECVLAWHFCNASNAESHDPSLILRSIAYRLASQLPEYRALLLEKAARGDSLSVLVEEGSPFQLFKELLQDPLATVSPPPMGRVVVIVDAVDVFSSFSMNSLMQILVNHWHLLPQWIGLVLTSRPEVLIMSPMAKFKPFRLDPMESRSRQDIRAFCRARLEDHIEDGDMETAVDVLELKSQFLFLYLRLALDPLLPSLDATVSLDQLKLLPRGLPALFEATMTRALREAGCTFVVLRPLFDVLVVAQQGVSPAFVAHVVSTKVDLTPVVIAVTRVLAYNHTVLAVADDCDPLCPPEDRRIRLASTAVAQWLVADDNYLHQADPVRGHDLIASACLRVMADVIDGPVPIRVDSPSKSAKGRVAVAGPRTTVQPPSPDAAFLKETRRLPATLVRADTASALMNLLSPTSKARAVSHRGKGSGAGGGGGGGRPPRKSAAEQAIAAAASRTTRTGDSVPTDPTPTDDPTDVPSWRVEALSYAIRHCPRHLRCATKWRSLGKLMCNLEYIKLRFADSAALGGRTSAEYELCVDVTAAAASSGDRDAAQALEALRSFRRFFETEKPAIVSFPSCVNERAKRQPLLSPVFKATLRSTSFREDLQSDLDDSDDGSDSDASSELSTSSDEGEYSGGGRTGGGGGRAGGRAGAGHTPAVTVDTRRRRSRPSKRAAAVSSRSASPGLQPLALTFSVESTGPGDSLTMPSMASDLNSTASGLSLTEDGGPLPTMTLADDSLLAGSMISTASGALSMTRPAERPSTASMGVENVPSPMSPMCVYTGHVGWVHSVAISDDGRRVVSCGADNTVKVWNAETGVLITTLEPKPKPADATAAAEGDLERPKPRMMESPWAVTISADGLTVACGGEDGVLHCWNVEGGFQVAELVGHKAWITDIALSSLCERLVSGSGDCYVKVWDVDAQLLVTEFKHPDTVWSVAVADHGKRVAAGTADGAVFVYDVEAGDTVCRLRRHRGAIYSLSLCDNLPEYVASGGWDQRVMVYDWTTQDQVWQHTAHSSPVRGVWMAEDGRSVFSGGDDGLVVRVTSNDGENRVEMKGHTDAVTSVMSSYDGLHAVSASKDGTVCVWSFV